MHSEHELGTCIPTSPKAREKSAAFASLTLPVPSPPTTHKAPMPSWFSVSRGHLSDCICVCACSVTSNSATSWPVAHQAPLSMGFPRQEYWSGLSFPPPGDLPDLSDYILIMNNMRSTHGHQGLYHYIKR